MDLVMKDVKKRRSYSAQESRERQRQANGRLHRKRHKRNLTLYYLLVMFFVLLVGGVLSVTVLFHITTINVVGTTAYGSDQIVECAKIQIGDNLFRTDTQKAAQRISEQLVYIERVEIRRRLPDGLDIIVEPAVPYANIQADGGYYLISKSGRVLESALAAPQEGTPVFVGYEPQPAQPGETLASSQEQKQRLVSELADGIAAAGIEGVRAVDITDPLNITIGYDGRIELQLGSTADLAMKLKVAKLMLTEKIGASERGTLSLTSAERASFIPEEDRPSGGSAGSSEPSSGGDTPSGGADVSSAPSGEDTASGGVSTPEDGASSSKPD